MCLAISSFFCIRARATTEMFKYKIVEPINCFSNKTVTWRLEKIITSGNSNEKFIFLVLDRQH